MFLATLSIYMDVAGGTLSHWTISLDQEVTTMTKVAINGLV